MILLICSKEELEANLFFKESKKKLGEQAKTYLFD